ncbi:hypothetical protein CHCC20335_1121 [Bacillus paralicheniformis]|nr:hypothetical protein CHCC20335_1121 [Bacillus paralicheniformis]
MLIFKKNISLAISGNIPKFLGFRANFRENVLFLRFLR